MLMPAQTTRSWILQRRSKRHAKRLATVHEESAPANGAERESGMQAAHKIKSGWEGRQIAKARLAAVNEALRDKLGFVPTIGEPGNQQAASALVLPEQCCSQEPLNQRARLEAERDQAWLAQHEVKMAERRAAEVEEYRYASHALGFKRDEFTRDQSKYFDPRKELLEAARSAKLRAKERPFSRQSADDRAALARADALFGRWS